MEKYFHQNKYGELEQTGNCNQDNIKILIKDYRNKDNGVVGLFIKERFLINWGLFQSLYLRNKEIYRMLDEEMEVERKNEAKKKEMEKEKRRRRIEKLKRKNKNNYQIT